MKKNRLIDYALNKKNYSKDDILLLLEELKRRGIILSYTLKYEGVLAVPAIEWLFDFWTPNKSEYLREKKRKGQMIHQKHTTNCRGFIKNHWAEILSGKSLGEINREDIQKQFNRLDEMELNGNTKNHILRAVFTPLKWAFNKEILVKDFSKGWIMYNEVYKKRVILTMETAKKVFHIKWNNDLTCLASMVAMCTGMRCGEILALTYEDLGDECIYVRHSYNVKDGLKCTKNMESRTVYIPFPFIMEKLKFYAEMSKKVSADNIILENTPAYIFRGESFDKPMDGKTCLNHLRAALIKTGMAEDEARQITFHAWRHFYTTYMSDKVNQRALQSQTGHKTASMLEHYANHQTLEEAKEIIAAQTQLFSTIFAGS